MIAPLTLLEQSAADTGRRFFAVSAQVYAALTNAIDSARNYPQGEGTAAVTDRGLPLPENLTVAIDGRLLISVETWRVTAADKQMIAPALLAGHLTELTNMQYAELLPARQTIFFP